MSTDVISASKETYFLREFEKGDFMLWDVCSQCMNTFTVTIRDDKKVYANIRKANPSTELQILSQESADYDGGSNLRIEIAFDNPDAKIKKSQTAGAIMDKQSNTVGFSYTYCIEDGDDWDFNDVFITVIAWKNKG